MRYFIEIAYNGENYHGWQYQPDARSVQETLEKKLSTFLREKIAVTGAGRTDTGVHARQMFAHLDTSQAIDDRDSFIFKLNSFLPKDVVLKNIFEVKEDAHARFDAISRTYEYIISLEKDPFNTGLAHTLYQKPDMDKMNAAALLLLQYKDFQCFSKTNTDVKTYICDLQLAKWREEENQLVFTITADRFLRNMVRAIVGTILDVGFNKIPVEAVHDIIKEKDRSKAGTSMPANGLYLTKIEYPYHILK